MFFAAFDPRYKKIYDDLNNASQFFLNNEIESCYELSCEALGFIEKECTNVDDIDLTLVHAELLCLRSQAFEKTGNPQYMDGCISDLEKAIKLVENKKEGEFSLFKALSMLGEILTTRGVREDTSYFDKAHDHLNRADKIIEIYKLKEPYQEKLSKARLATCYSINLEGNHNYDAKKAISLLVDCHDFFEVENSKDDLLIAKLQLADCHENLFFETKNQIHLDKSLQYLIECTTVIDPDDLRVGVIASRMGSLILRRNRPYKKNDAEAAFEVLNMAHGMINKEKQYQEWILASINLVLAYIQFIEYYPEAKFHEEGKSISLNLIKGVVDSIKLIQNPEIAYKAITTLAKIENIYEEKSNFDIEGPLKLFLNKIEDSEEYVELYSEATLFLLQALPDHEAIDHLNETLKKIDRERHPQAWIDLNIHLGYLYSAKEDHKKASDYFKLSITLINQLKNDLDRNNINTFRQVILLNDIKILTIIYSLLEAEDFEFFLFAIELLRFHPITPVIEELFVIEKQIDRKYWLFQHKRTKQFELFMQNTTKGVEEEMDDVDMSAYAAHLKKKNVDIDRAGNYYKEIDSIIERDYQYTSDYFIENISKSIPSFDSWVLLPVFNDHQLRWVLLPPNDINNPPIISKKFDSGYIEALKLFVSDDNLGWAECVMKFSSNLSKIKNDESLANFIKEEKLLEIEEKMHLSFDKMEQYLWEMLGEWLSSELEKMNINFPISLVVIAQGPFSQFPFCIAKNPLNDKALLDYADIAYSPSIYALHTLTERLKEEKYSKSLGFLYQDVDEDRSDEKITYLPMEKQIIENCFKDNDFYAGEIIPEDLVNICNKSSYWHFSTHGEFSWHDFAQSKLQWTKKGPEAKLDLTPELLASLESEVFLRLVVLSACQSAVPEFLNNELAPQSFLTELLKCGTIGAIGTLWEVPDVAAALILGRFYYFHMIVQKVPSVALRASQLWLKNITCENLCFFLSDSSCQSEEAMAFATELKSEYEPDEKPFESPLFWGSFVLVGQ